MRKAAERIQVILYQPLRKTRRPQPLLRDRLLQRDEAPHRRRGTRRPDRPRQRAPRTLPCHLSPAAQLRGRPLRPGLSAAVQDSAQHVQGPQAHLPQAGPRGCGLHHRAPLHPHHVGLHRPAAQGEPAARHQQAVQQLHDGLSQPVLPPEPRRAVHRRRLQQQVRVLAEGLPPHVRLPAAPRSGLRPPADRPVAA